MILLTPRDAGKRLGIGTHAVQDLAKRGLLRELRDSGNRRLFRPADVERLRVKREKAKAKAEREKAGVLKVARQENR